MQYANGEAGKRERNKVRTALKGWLERRCAWPSESVLAETLTALVRWVFYEHGVGFGQRVSGKLLSRWFDALPSPSASSAGLVGLGVGEAAAHSIVAGNLAPSSGVSPSAAASSSSSSSSAAGPSRDVGEQSDAVRPAHPQAQPKRSDAWDASLCSCCGAAVGALSALVVDKKRMLRRVLRRTGSSAACRPGNDLFPFRRVVVAVCVPGCAGYSASDGIRSEARTTVHRWSN